MKKLLTLTLSLLMIFSLCLTISADGGAFKIDEQEYDTLEDAISAASVDGETTITLIKDEYIASNEIIIGKDIVLDLNGKRLIAEKAIYVNGKTLKVKDGTNRGTLEFSSYDHSEKNAHIYVQYAGEFILESGTIYNNCSKGGPAIISQGSAYEANPIASKVTINGGYMVSGEYCIGVYGYGASVEVKDGSLRSTSNKAVFKDLGYTNTNPITVSGGSFSSDVSAYLKGAYNIIKQKSGDSDVFKLVENGAKVEVENTTAAMTSTARTILNTANNINGGAVKVDSSTQLVLNTELLEGANEEEVNAVVKEAIGNDFSNFSYITPFDITLTAITSDGAETEITDLGETVEIPVTLYLNETDANTLKGKKIKVVRIHNDDGIKALDAILNDNVLTFNSGKFSTFVICYEDTKKEEKKEETTTTTDTTSSTKVVTCEEAMDSKNWTWSESKKACVYRVTNTGSK